MLDSSYNPSEMDAPTHRNNLGRFLRSFGSDNPSLASFLYTAAFFALYLLVFRPAYLVNDDLTIISLATGYWGGLRVPFLVYSNVIWGFLLVLLYGIPGNINWGVWLFVLINFLSVWSLVYLALSRPLRPLYRVAGVFAILACDGHFLMHITYTMIAAFAALAGFCTILTASWSPFPLKRRLLVVGGLLVLTASLIRIQALLLVLLVIAAPALIMIRAYDLRALVATLAITATLVAGCYAFDKLYVGLHPDWSAYYNYNRVRSLVHDTPRLEIENMASFLPEVHWSQNDYALFTSWFFADREVYSLPRLQYLVAHVSDQAAGTTERSLLAYDIRHILNGRDALPFVLIAAAAWFLAVSYRPLRRALPSLGALFLSAALSVLYIVWRARLPIHVWFSFLATLCIFALCILSWHVKTPQVDRQPEQKSPRSRWNTAVSLTAMIVICLSLMLALYRASVLSRINADQQSYYQRILANLDGLRAQGKLPSNALIISPLIGIPLEWSNPFILELPHVQYFQMEWLTFSPAYDKELRDYGVQSLPAGFYQNQNLYLMTTPSVLNWLVGYIREHQAVNVKPQCLYSLGNNLDVFTKVAVCKLVQTQ